MKIETRYSNVDRSEALENYIRSKAKSLVRRFEPNNGDMRMIVRIENFVRRITGTAKEFVVEVTLHRPRRKDFVVKKRNVNVHRGITSAIGAIEKIARREQKKGERDRKIRPLVF